MPRLLHVGYRQEALQAAGLIPKAEGSPRLQDAPTQLLPQQLQDQHVVA